MAGDRADNVQWLCREVTMFIDRNIIISGDILGFIWCWCDWQQFYLYGNISYFKGKWCQLTFIGYCRKNINYLRMD